MQLALLAFTLLLFAIAPWALLSGEGTFRAHR
jgi:hypothetical protein